MAPRKGDVVEVTWLDHFRYQGNDLPIPMSVKTWGIFEEETEHGVAIVQNEVQTGGDPHIDRIMDAQFCLLPCIQEIRVLYRVADEELTAA